MLDFHPLTLEDKALVQRYTFHSNLRNCDLCFMNLMSWRFLYDTEVAECDGFLVFRFYTDEHLAYLAPLGKGEWKNIVQCMMDDTEAQGQPFLMVGVTERTLTYLNAALPDYFYATADRDYSDYIYEREKLASLAGKKLQPKRNHINQFLKLYPNYELLPLTKEMMAECLALETQWQEDKKENSLRENYADEHRSLEYVMAHWDELDGQGLALRVEEKLVAFTFGAPINCDTFDVCVEKADVHYEGAYPFINREFARSLPTRFKYINREEDLGVPGLRHAKTSYKPTMLLHKFAVMLKHPFGKEHK